MANFEDFTTYTEVEQSGNIITVNKHSLEYNGYFYYDSYVYKDKGVNHFKTFSHNFACKINQNLNAVNASPYYLSNVVKSWGDAYNNNDDGIALALNRTGGGAHRFYFYNLSNHNVDEHDISNNTIYYCTVERAGNSSILKIYTDSERTNLDDVIYITTDLKYYRYIYPISGCGSGGAYGINIFSYNLDLQETGCDRFTITGDTATIELDIPNIVTWETNRGIQQFHFWSGSNIVFDIGKDTESITLSGFENSSTSVLFSELDEIVDAGEEVTLAGFNNNQLDTTWIISEYNYIVSGGKRDSCEWNIILEKA